MEKEKLKRAINLCDYAVLPLFCMTAIVFLNWGTNGLAIVMLISMPILNAMNRMVINKIWRSENEESS